MITISHTSVSGWEAALRGMRNPLNSWDRADSYFKTSSGTPVIGKNDLALMHKLCQAGSEHRKFMRYIIVTFDMTAPHFFWHQFDTYKVGTVRNSCSKMHKLTAKEYTIDDFATDGMSGEALGVLNVLIDQLNNWRTRYLQTPTTNAVARRDLWDAILRVMPESYLQTATIQLNYEVLRAMYHQRINHKLPEWHQFCTWI